MEHLSCFLINSYNDYRGKNVTKMNGIINALKFTKSDMKH